MKERQSRRGWEGERERGRQTGYKSEIELMEAKVIKLWVRSSVESLSRDIEGERKMRTVFKMRG